MRKRVFSTLIIVGLFFSIAILLIAYARGFRLDTKNKSILSTGLLVATSLPDGASVFVNDHLTTATNTTINLPPGDYKVRITKEGYIPWQKSLKIQPEIVTKTDALLFPSTPELKPLTVSGAINPSLAPDGTKILFAIPPIIATDSGEIDRSGLYIFDMLDRPLSFSRTARRVVKSTPFFDFSKATIIWSPDTKSVVALFGTELEPQTAFLLQTDTDNINPQDITPTLAITLDRWNTDQNLKYQDQLASLPKIIINIATSSAAPVKFSPDETKILYEATASATIPQVIKPPLIGSNSQPEEREIKKGNIYVYDVKEDKNFNLGKTSTLLWFPDSKHFLTVEKEAISLMEYDGTNKTTVYAGPFEDTYVFPWPNGSKLVILTTLNKSAGNGNLYSLGLK